MKREEKSAITVLDTPIMTATLTISLIVRNEEQSLGRCLDSVQGLGDEIVVVDTALISHAPLFRQGQQEIQQLKADPGTSASLGEFPRRVRVFAAPGRPRV